MTSESAAFDPADPIFISYRQKDGTGVAGELSWLLRAAGIPVWRDRDDLPPGDTEARLKQAIAAGIAGGVLVVTPDVANSRIVKALEAPQLLKLHADHEKFVLGITNSVKTKSGGTDYDAPDRLLELRLGTLSGVDQQAAEREGLRALVRGLVWHRIACLRERIAANDHTFNLSVQTRNTPQVYDRTGDELDIRLRTSDHERLPSRDGLQDLKDTVGLLPDAVTRSGAGRVRVTGGAHLSVAFALGAALPSSRIGQIDVVDQRGDIWTSAEEARFADQPRVETVGQWAAPRAAIRATTSRAAVSVYVDLNLGRSDTAFARYLEENEASLAGWRHLRIVNEILLDPADAGAVASEVAAHVRQISYENSNAEIHMLLRCPFPIAVLLGRLTNTLRCVLYEWDDSDPVGSADFGARYLPALRVLASSGSGVIQEVLL